MEDLQNDVNPEGKKPEGNKKERNKNVLIYGILILALVATWAYIYWDKSQNNQHQEELKTQVAEIDSSKVAIEQQFKATLVKLDMLKTENDSLMKTKSKEIGDLKARIQNILNNKNSSEADLAKAQQLISRLKDQVAVYKNEIEKLKGEKITLVAQRDSIQSNLDTVSAKNKSLSLQNDTLSQQISLASILHATNFDIIPIHVKNSGKEKTTNKARRTDIIRISFDIEKNLVADSGQKELFICINNPKGLPIAIEKKGSGKFLLTDGKEKLYTTKTAIDYHTGERQKVEVDWEQAADFEPGKYTVEVYQKGHLIGQGTANLKKGGFIF